MDNFKISAATLFHELVQIERSEFFGDADGAKWLPKFQVEDAKTMCPPFMGKNYKKGGLIIISINPGGGNKTSEIRDNGDSILYPAAIEFKNLDSGIENYYWDIFVDKFIQAKMSYPIYRKMFDILDASNTTLDDICYFNFLPYRGRENEYPKSKTDMAKIIPICINKFVQPLLKHLEPSLVVAFGKRVNIYIEDYWDNFEYNTVTWNRARAVNKKVLKEREQSLAQLKEWAEIKK